MSPMSSYEITAGVLFVCVLTWLTIYMYKLTGQFVYLEMRSITEHRSNQFGQWMILVLCSFYIGRVLFVTVIMAKPDIDLGHEGIIAFGHQMVEFKVANNFQSMGKGDSFFLISFISVFIFGMTVHQRLYLRCNPYTDRKYANLMVYNWDAFLRSNRSNEVQARLLANRVTLLKGENEPEFGLLTGFVSSGRIQIKARFDHWTDVESRCDVARFNAIKLPHFPTMSVKTRLKFVRLSLWYDCFVMIVLRVAYVCIACGWMSVPLYYGHLVPSWSRCLYLFDCLCLTYLSMRLAMLAVLIVACSTFGTCLYHWTLSVAVVEVTRHLNRMLCMFHHHRPRDSLKGCKVKLCRAVCRLIGAHVQLCHVLMTTNDEVWSTIVLLSIATQLPCNGYLVQRCAIQYLSLRAGNWSWPLFVMASFAVIQLVIVIVGLLPLVGITQAMHCPTRVLPSVVDVLMTRQGHSTRRRPSAPTLVLVIKCMSLYERLTTGRKYGVSIGPFKTITRRALFQLTMLYLVGLLNVIKFFIEH